MTDERSLQAPPGPGSGARAGICLRVLQLWIHPAFPVLFRRAHYGPHLGELRGVRHVRPAAALAAGLFRRRTVLTHGQVLLRQTRSHAWHGTLWPGRAASVHGMRRQSAAGRSARTRRRPAGTRPPNLTQGAARPHAYPLACMPFAMTASMNRVGQCGVMILPGWNVSAVCVTAPVHCAFLLAG